MKTFKDLVFTVQAELTEGGSLISDRLLGFIKGTSLPLDRTCTQAVITFDNGYGVSVITGRYLANTVYEIAIVKNGEIEKIERCSTEEGITEIMKRIQKRKVFALPYNAL